MGKVKIYTFYALPQEVSDQFLTPAAFLIKTFPQKVNSSKWNCLKNIDVPKLISLKSLSK
jgi:hypothetical protein